MTQEAQAESAIRTLAPTAPSVGVAGLTIAGFPLSDWVLFATLVYTVCQIIIASPKLIKTVRGWLE